MTLETSAFQPLPPGHSCLPSESRAAPHTDTILPYGVGKCVFVFLQMLCCRSWSCHAGFQLHSSYWEAHMTMHCLPQKDAKLEHPWPMHSPLGSAGFPDLHLLDWPWQHFQFGLRTSSHSEQTSAARKQQTKAKLHLENIAITAKNFVCPIFTAL